MGLQIIFTENSTGLKRIQSDQERLRRTTSMTLKLNPREAKALDIYCKRFRIRKSEFIRHTVMQAIIGRFDNEHPSLWEQEELTLFSGGTKNS